MASSRVEAGRSEEHTSELQSHSEISYAVFCLKKKNRKFLTKCIGSVSVKKTQNHTHPSSWPVKTSSSTNFPSVSLSRFHQDSLLSASCNAPILQESKLSFTIRWPSQ